MKLEMTINNVLLTVCVMGFVFLVQACASTPASKGALAEAEVCCENLEQLEYETIPSVDPSTSPFKIKIDSNSPVYTFGGGRSYFAAYKLTPEQSGTGLWLRIEPSGLTSFTERTFCPVITYLNSNYEPIESEKLGINWVPPGALTKGYWMGAQKIPADANHLMVHTTEELLKKELAITPNTDTYTVMIGYSVVSFPVTSGTGIQCAPTGEVKVVLLG